MRLAAGNMKCILRAKIKRQKHVTQYFVKTHLPFVRAIQLLVINAGKIAINTYTLIPTKMTKPAINPIPFFSPYFFFNPHSV